MPEVESPFAQVEGVIERTRHHSESAARWVEVLEAVALAVVAVATAWSGFQAAKWSGVSTQTLALGLRTTVLAQEKATLAGQDRIYDAFAFNNWLGAKANRNEKLAAKYKRRFRPEYAATFTAWLKLDPFHTPSAPPGPIFMKEYSNAHARESAKLNEDATRFFDKSMSMSMRATSEEYVRVTVFFATVLLLTVIGQRMRSLWARGGIVIIACILLGSSAYRLLTLPHSW